MNSRAGSKSIMGIATIVWAGALVCVMAGPGEGIKVGDTTLSPYLDVQGAYDSNVQVTDKNAQDDVLFVETVGLDVSRMTDKVKLSGKAWVAPAQYVDLSEEDHTDFGAKVAGLLGTREMVEADLGAEYKQLEQLDYSTKSIEERKMTDLRAGVGRSLTDKLEGDIAGTYSSTDYTSEDLLDWSEAAMSVEMGHAMTAKTAATITGRLASQDKTLDSNATLGSVLVGVKSRRTDKLSANAGVGFRSCDYGDDTMNGFSFKVGGTWKATPMMTVRATAGDETLPATQDLNNERVVTTVNAAVDYKIATDYTATVNGTYRNEKYDKLVNGQTKKSDSIGGSARLTYQAPVKFLQLYGEVNTENYNSSINGNDFTKTMVLAGATVRY